MVGALRPGLLYRGAQRLLEFKIDVYKNRYQEFVICFTKIKICFSKIAKVKKFRTKNDPKIDQKSTQRVRPKNCVKKV